MIDWLLSEVTCVVDFGNYSSFFVCAFVLSSRAFHLEEAQLKRTLLRLQALLHPDKFTQKSKVRSNQLAIHNYTELPSLKTESLFLCPGGAKELCRAVCCCEQGLFHLGKAIFEGTVPGEYIRSTQWHLNSVYGKAGRRGVLVE